MSTFTWRSPHFERDGLLVELTLRVPPVLARIMKSDRLGIPPPRKVLGLIDTGARRTCVTRNAVEALRLKPIGMTPIGTASHSNFSCPVVRVVVQLKEDRVEHTIMAIQVPSLSGGVECLVGRDILSKSLLVCYGSSGDFSLSF